MRSNSGGGVPWYTKCTANIFFPKGDVRCSLCPCLETYARKQCRLTGEYLADGHLMGFECPLDIDASEVTDNV